MISMKMKRINTVNNTLSGMAANSIVALCLTADNFTHQGENTPTQQFNLLVCYTVIYMNTQLYIT
jgi:hypothetical protein